MAAGKKSPQGDESRMRHPSWSQGRVLGLGVVRLLVHGWVAQDSVQRSEDMGRSIGTPWDTQGCGQGEEHQWVLSGCRTPKPHSRGQEGTHVMGRRQAITSRNIISGRPRECTCLAPGERLEQWHSHFPFSSRWKRCEETHPAGCVSGHTPPPPRRAPRSRLTGQG